MSVLTEADRQILPGALRKAGGFALATKWYLHWEPMPKQWAWHQVDKVNTVFLAGIAAGKTAGVAASYLIDCISIPYFKALNTSVTAKQAELPFEMVTPWIEGNPKLEHLVENISLRPFPIITFKNYSEWHFRTAGMDARFIKGFEYDRANFDECGLDLNGAIVKVLRGRLRGERPDGTKRIARLDTTTSPTAALWLKERFYKGWPSDTTADLEQYISQRMTTWENTHLTPQQIKAMESEYPPDMLDVEMGAQFPDFGMSMFPTGHIEACTDISLYDACYTALNPEDGKSLRGYQLEEDPRHGVTLFEIPVKPGHVYIISGDPGMDSYPKRNAPCVLVADVTHKPYQMVYFYWGEGKGSYTPFLSHYRYALDKYGPILRGIDATGPQSGLADIAWENQGIEVDKLNFGTDKAGMLNNLSIDVTSHYWSWPPIKGLIRQMNTYIPTEDKKIPQDIVMSLAEISYLARFIPAEDIKNAVVVQANYRDRRNRTNVRPRR